MTLKEIAAMAGVSPAAVSRYLNGGSLSQEKQDRIRAVIEQTDFRPNRLAHDLRTGTVRQVGVIVPKIHSASVSEVLAGIDSVLSEKGYLTVLGCTDGDVKKEPDYLSLMQSYQLAGLIVMAQTAGPEQEKQYAECTLPLVITGQNVPSLSCVYHDDLHAMQELARRMMARGRKRVAYIGATETDPAVGAARRNGAFLAFEEAGLNINEIPYEISPFSIRGGKEAMQRILDSGVCPDGVLCATDSIAQGAMVALKEEGLRIPEQVSIAGVGNDDSGLISEPQLTTARLYQNECGKQAARMLLEHIESGAPARHVMLGYSIVERGSL